MSLTLPPRPSLDHLKKQAKARLEAMQATAPDAQLADAQHALARDYGFASWPKLKAHVEALEQSPPAPPTPPAPAAPALGGSFGRYTYRARQALFFSRFEAAQLGSPTIDSEHLLLGLIHARQGLQTPASVALPLADLRVEVESHTTKAEPLSTSVVIPFSEVTRLVLQRAVDEADRLQHPQIGTMHLLLGVLRDPALLASSVLSKWDVTYATLAADQAAFTGDE
jgi:hypothetical protein